LSIPAGHAIVVAGESAPVNQVNSSLHRLLSSILLLCAIWGAGAQTIRQEAESRFDSLTWAEGNRAQAQELPGRSLPGGNETFPLLESSNGIIREGIFPSYSGLGMLDYGEMDQPLVEAARAVAASLTEKRIDLRGCSSRSQWVALLSEYRLQSYPKPQGVRFSAADNSDPSQPSIVFRLSFIEERAALYVRASFTEEEGQWKVLDFTLLGERNGTGAFAD